MHCIIYFIQICLPCLISNLSHYASCFLKIIYSHGSGRVIQKKSGNSDATFAKIKQKTNLENIRSNFRKYMNSQYNQL